MREIPASLPDHTTMSLSNDFGAHPGPPQVSLVAIPLTIIHAVARTTLVPSTSEKVRYKSGNWVWPPQIDSKMTGGTTPEYLVHLMEYLDRKIQAIDKHQEANRRYDDSRIAIILSIVLASQKMIYNMANLVELSKWTISVILFEKNYQQEQFVRVLSLEI